MRCVCASLRYVLTRALSSPEGYRLSKPIASKVTNLLYVDDLKVFAASEGKLNRVLKMVKTAMENVRLQWNPKKCTPARRWVVSETSDGFTDGQITINCLKVNGKYIFVGANGAPTTRGETSSRHCSSCLLTEVISHLV